LGVQAQVLSAAGLALAARTEGLTPDLVERARVAERSIVLAWMMRGTLHLVAAEDYGWLTRWWWSPGWPTRAGAFVLVRDWIGEPKAMERDAALAELAIRFLVAHEPAAPADLAVWSGLRMGDVNRAWRAVGDRLAEGEGPGGRLWTLRSRRAEAPAGLVRLLPSFAEHVLGWKDRVFCVEPDRWKLINRGGGWLHPVVVADGRFVPEPQPT
jgi:hypothetical protein